MVDILRFGAVTPKPVKGGLNVIDETTGAPVVIVNAGLVVRVPDYAAAIMRIIRL